MRLLKFYSYFVQLRSLVGLGGAVAFTFAHLRYKLAPPQGGALAEVPVGPYRFCFSSLEFFESQFTEIFFKETYYLEATDRPLFALDAGANIGVSLLYIKIRAPLARVLCFEPNPAARALLEKNIALNHWQNEVRVVSHALGGEKGEVTFFVDEREATSTGGSVAHHEKNENRTVRSYPVTVDTLSHYIDQPVDFLKLDIEGAEGAVLDELVKNGVLSKVATIQLEYHYMPGHVTRPLSEILALLEAHGFKTYVESNTLPHRIINQDVWHTYMVFAWRSLSRATKAGK